MKISIAMATYNGAKYLQEQLESFINQTNQPDELVVCDDCSTDETIGILREFQLQAPFVVNIYQNKNNLGHKKNFEKTLNLCNGDLIFISDQDDRWFPEKIEKMATVIEKNKKIHVLVADMIIVDQNMNTSKLTQLKNHLAMGLSRENYGPGCVTVIRKSFLKILLPIPFEVTGHDSWIHKVSNALDVRDILEEPVQFYRRHGYNSSNSLTSQVSVPTSIKFLQTYGFRSAENSWKSSMIIYQCVIFRIDSSRNILTKLKLVENADSALLILNKKIHQLKTRIDLMKMARLNRVFHILNFWYKDGYNQFSGWRSAVKDIFRSG